MVKLLLLLIILILVNAFLAASEVSVVSLNKNRLRELAEDGDRKAQRLLKFAEEPNIFLSTIQVGITLAGFLASAAAADGFAGGLMAWLYERLGTSGISLSVCHVLAVVLVTVVLSYFALLFFIECILWPMTLCMYDAYVLKQIISFFLLLAVLFLLFPDNSKMRIFSSFLIHAITVAFTEFVTIMAYFLVSGTIITSANAWEIPFGYYIIDI